MYKETVSESNSEKTGWIFGTFNVMEQSFKNVCSTSKTGDI